MKSAITTLEKLNTHLYKAFSEISNLDSKVLINDKRKKEIITKALEDVDYLVDERMFDAFLEKVNLDCSTQYENFVNAVEGTLDECYELTFKSSLNDWQKAFIPDNVLSDDEEYERRIETVFNSYEVVNKFSEFNTMYSHCNGHLKTTAKVFQKQF